MKKLLLVFLFFLSISSFAQMDTEHWFAPMSQQAANGQDEMSIYLSTDQTVPFYVKLENNKTVFDSVQISKGNPQHRSIPFEKMVTGNGNTYRIDSLGLHAFGNKKFFANLRFSQVNHAEIITSKGKAGLGKYFFSVYAPFKQNAGTLNYTIGILATEDNTEVEIENITNGTPIILNRGQSYILDGFPFDESLIGRTITATKPVTITNGNYNGQYATTNTNSGSDILMDQAVPVERLGKEYILMKGNGGTNDNMESAIIVATENNTEVYFNGIPTPYRTLQKGEYFLMPTSFYKFRAGDVYNAYVVSSKNIYIYQLLSGSGTLAAGGLNYIPPLNCYLPKKIDEIGFIDENPGFLGGQYTPTHNTKLNIITQNGAGVKINGTSINGVFGPYAVDGTNEWVTFSVPNVSGTIVLESDKAVTAGIAAGDGAVGYGGYFAGASSLPIITKTGTCFPGVKLEVDDTFDDFQWQILNPLTGIFENIPGANTFTYTPTSAGDFRCVLGSVSCGQIITPSFLVLKCTVNSQQNILTCKDFTITPKLSPPSLQTVDISKTRISVQPKYGTVAIQANGDLVYTPNAGFVDNTLDSFTYYIQGQAAYPDSESVTVKITLRKLTVQNQTLYSCLNTATGEALYDLSTANVTLEPSNGIKYFKDQALTQPILIFNAYSSAPGKVYAQVFSSFGCSDIAEITLLNYSVPNIDTSKYLASHCDDNLDGKIDIIFSDVSNIIVNNVQDFNIIYSLSPTFSPSLPNNWSYSSDTKVYVKVESKKGCPPVTGEIDFKLGNKILVSDFSASICDNDLNGSETDLLSNYLSQLTSAPYTSVKYFNTLADAQNNVSSSEISASQTITAAKTFYIRFENNSSTNFACPNVAKLTLSIKQPLKSTVLKDKMICPQTVTTLDAGGGFEGYLWSLNNQTTQQISNVPVGDYYVDLFSNGCVYRQQVTVAAAPIPVITSIIENGNSITVNVSGGTLPYYYSIDGINYQQSNVFENLPKGIQTVYVQSAERCTPVQKKFLIVNLLNVITPNNDGYNDFLDYSDLKIKNDVKIEIFDRFGSKVYTSDSKTDFIWDGTVNGRPLPTATYWYNLSWTEPDIGVPVSYKGWVLLKNRN